MEARANGAHITPPLFVTTFIQIGAASLRPSLARAGVDTALVDRWFAGQPDTVKLDVSIDRQESEAIMRGLIAAQAPLTANEALLGSYIGILILQERLRRGLPPLN